MSDQNGAAHGRQGKESEASGAAQPRSWLSTYLLMMLRSWNAYGYELVRQLAFFGFPTIDRAAVYRALRELEQEGYVTSSWDTSVTSGPARRIYAITEAGVATLNVWAAALDNYRQTLDRLFQLYQGEPAANGAATAETEADEVAP